MKNGQGKSLFSECLATDENRLGFDSFQNKLERFGARKTRAVDLAKYITDFHTGNNRAGAKSVLEKANLKIAVQLGSCASYLLFRNYYRRDELRLHSANLCRRHLLCPFCAACRAAKYLQAYMERFQVVTAENPQLRPFFVTITIKDQADLGNAFNHLRGAMRKMSQQRRDALKGQRFVEFAKALGGVHSVEFKRGRGSGLWHPHAHMIWLCEEAPDARKLSAEWLAITGDSYIVDVRECYGETLADSFLEVFKYALKFSDLELADNWEAYNTLKGKRLVDSFGCLKGVEVPESLLDEELADEPYLLMLYRYLSKSGYNFVGQGDEQDISELMKR